jgi:hypothetical protein
MGWAPKDQWRGPEDQWKPADQFIRETPKIIAHLKNELHQSKRDFESRAERSERMAKVALAQQRKQIEDAYEIRKQAAVKDADDEAYAAARDAQAQALKTFDENATEKPDGSNGMDALPPGVREATEAFAANNRDWFEIDHAMTGAAVALWGDYQDRFPTMAPSSIADMVQQDIDKRFNRQQPSAQNTNQNRPAQAPVEGGLRPISGAVKKGWDALPPEAKRAGQSYIDDGLFGDDTAKAKQAYAEQYWAQ